MSVQVRDKFLIPRAKEPFHTRALDRAKSALGLNGKPEESDGRRTRLPAPDPETIRSCQEALDSIRQISKDEAAQKLSRVTGDWNDLTAKALNLPLKLYIFEQTSGIFMSPDRSFGVIDVENYLVESWNPDLQFPKLPQYGIGLSGRGSTYITLVDMSRRIVVRERAFSEHESGDNRWTRFSNAIRTAAARAEKARARERNQVVVCNEGLLHTYQL